MSRRAGAIVAAGAIAAAYALFVGACLDDLAQPTKCPPDAVVEAKSCFGVLERTQPGCIMFQEGGLADLACLTGPRTTCDCLPDECPASDDACYPRKDCPSAVTDAVGEGASCPKLKATDFSPIETILASSQCACGCLSCATACDGKGPVFGTVNDGTPTFTTTVIKIADEMPDAGTVGLFVRARGFSNAVIYVIVGPFPTVDGSTPEIVSAYYLTTVPDAFGDLVFTGEDNLVPGRVGEAYSWTTADRKPTFLAISPPGPEGGVGEPVQSLWELDCIIPFLAR